MEEERITIKQLNEQMFNAVLEDNINKVEESLDFGANNFGNCIKFAAHYGRLFILKSLVEVGSFDSKQLEPALKEAVKNNQTDIVRYLTDNFKGIESKKAIELATGECLTILLDYYKQPPDKPFFFKF
jgi:hypothetical protein